MHRGQNKDKEETRKLNKKCQLKENRGNLGLYILWK